MFVSSKAKIAANSKQQKEKKYVMAKRLVFSDESINSYGFWLKNDGADLSLFSKNPILLWMHNRSWRGTKDEVLPLGTVKDVKFNAEKEQWEAEPDFDMGDAFAAEIARKWEAGVLRMCSAGITPKEFSEEKKLMKPGQTRATVTKWQLKEISIVDIGSNQNAIALFNEDDEQITLADGNDNLPVPLIRLFNQNNNNMEVIKLSDGTEMTVDQVQKLRDDNAQHEQSITTLTAERDGFKSKVEGFELAEKTALKNEAETLLNDAIKDGRVDATPGADGKTAKEVWLKFFETDHASAKSALASIPKRQKTIDKLNDDQETEREKFEKLSWDEMDQSGKLETLKLKHWDLYESKFEEKFGNKPTKK